MESDSRSKSIEKAGSWMVSARRRLYWVALYLVSLQVGILSMWSPTSSAQDFDWRSDWSVRRGYSLTIDTQGYVLPTAIAFVRQPGSDPKDPLYFVTELRGTVKVVTNDRSVHTFAQKFFKPPVVAAYGAADSLEVGLTGICLEPERGYVFVTFAYRDSGGVLRNNILRFQSTPQTFSLRPWSSVDFSHVLIGDQSNASHQIGPCQVHDEMLYVSIGDGEQPLRSRDLRSTLGKVLRMTLDGKPVMTNPFYDKHEPQSPAGYVWAYGLRNPFGLRVIDEGVFVVDNGPGIDRFLKAEEGEDYLWAGSDGDIGARALAVIAPGNGVAALDYHPGDPGGFPAGFFFNVTGAPTNLNEELPPHVLRIEYDPDRDRVLSAPKPFVRYRGKQVQVLAGLAFGPDGLYFVPMLPNRAGVTAVLRVAPDPSEGYPFLLEDDIIPLVLMRERACLACHSLARDPRPGVGPGLHAELLIPRLKRRLSSQGYASAVRRLDALDEEPYVSFRSARKAILNAQGLEQARLWVKYKILEPRFDNLTAMMPYVGISETEAEAIADFLVPVTYGRETIVRRLAKLLPFPIRRRHLAAFFLSGFVVGSVPLALLYIIALRRRWAASASRVLKNAC